MKYNRAFDYFKKLVYFSIGEINQNVLIEPLLLKRMVGRHMISAREVK